MNSCKPQGPKPRTFLHIKRTAESGYRYAVLAGLTLSCSTGAGRDDFSRPYPKKKNAPSARNPNVIPNIPASYFQSDVICFAGENAKTIPSTVVRNPAPPANNKVPLP